MERKLARGSRLTDDQLLEMEREASSVGEVGWRHQPDALDVFVLRGNDETVHLYAPRGKGEAILAALERAREDIPRLVAEVRRLRAELAAALDENRSRLAAARPVSAPAPPPAVVQDLAEDAPLSLAAPFRVGPREMKLAKDDPLVALAVQVAKGLQSDASELERARLIAMAFAAARGDLSSFWAARQQRSAKKAEAAGRKK